MKKAILRAKLRDAQEFVKNVEKAKEVKEVKAVEKKTTKKKVK